MDCSPPGSSVNGILQARILERAAISFSRGSSQTRDLTWLSCTAGKLYPLSHQGRPWKATEIITMVTTRKRSQELSPLHLLCSEQPRRAQHTGHHLKQGFSHPQKRCIKVWDSVPWSPTASGFLMKRTAASNFLVWRKEWNKIWNVEPMSRLFIIHPILSLVYVLDPYTTRVMISGNCISLKLFFLTLWL